MAPSDLRALGGDDRATLDKLGATIQIGTGRGKAEYRRPGLWRPELGANPPFLPEHRASARTPGCALNLFAPGAQPQVCGAYEPALGIRMSSKACTSVLFARSLSAPGQIRVPN